jgi:hypothetical protein
MSAARWSMRGVTYSTLVVVLSWAWCGPAQAGGLTLTAAGIAQGLSLSTFADNFPHGSNGIGPIGITFPTTGGVLITESSGNVRLFPTDTDGQNAASITPINNFGGGGAFGLARLNGNIYMTQQPQGDVVQLINNGASTQVVVSGIPGASAILADPFNNLLYVDRSGNGPGLYVVDPIAKTKTLFEDVTTDGLSLSADGETLYGAAGTHVLGFDIKTGKTVFDSGFIAGGPDGTAVGTGPIFSGLLFANTNGGTVVEINLKTLAQTTIATGGSRGDLVAVDPYTNTLLLTQTDSVVRLSGASFTSVPEPTTLVMGGTAVMMGLGCWVLRSQRRAT